MQRIHSIELNHMKWSMSSSICLCMLVLAAVLMGCTTTTKEYRLFRGHFESDDQNRVFQRVHGGNTLLEIFHFAGSPFIPGAFGGYSLFIEGAPGVFKEGEVIEIPSEKVSVAYYSDYHHVGRVERNITGRIRVIEVKENSIRAGIDIEVAETKQRIKLTETFVKRDVEKYSEQLP